MSQNLHSSLLPVTSRVDDLTLTLTYATILTYRTQPSTHNHVIIYTSPCIQLTFSLSIQERYMFNIDISFYMHSLKCHTIALNLNCQSQILLVKFICTECHVLLLISLLFIVYNKCHILFQI